MLFNSWQLSSLLTRAKQSLRIHSKSKLSPNGRWFLKTTHIFKTGKETFRKEATYDLPHTSQWGNVNDQGNLSKSVFQMWGEIFSFFFLFNRSRACNSTPSLKPLSTKKERKTWVWEYTCFGCETKTKVVRILVFFQHRHMFSHINGKLSPRPSELHGWT